jgi:rubrerythrin
LHDYWDKGAGILLHKEARNPAFVKQFAEEIEEQWPCKVHTMDISAENWVRSSHALAIKVAYNIKAHTSPSKGYQKNAQKLTIKQIAKAGCRLAAVLNAVN